jgi:fructuronate reductase
LNTVREQILHKRPFSKISLALAAWMRFILGVDEFGKVIEICDPMSERFNKIAFETGLLVSKKIVFENSESYTRAILDITEIFGEDLSQNSLFCAQIQKTFTRLLEYRSARSIEKLVK